MHPQGPEPKTIPTATLQVCSGARLQRCAVGKALQRIQTTRMTGTLGPSSM
jgi:hypothetical protein